MVQDPLVSIVVPCFNEEENVSRLCAEVTDVLKGYRHEIILVDDGSRDGTLAAIKALRVANPRIKYLSFSRNFGHQFALKAGIDHSSGHCVITMDSDLQHPPSMLPELINQWQAGATIVYTKRRTNKDYSMAKKVTANLFYKLISGISDVPIEPDSADFRLIDKSVADLLRPVKDNFLFLRGLLPWMGFPSTTVIFDVNPRLAGKTKYTFRKMFAFAINGITSFSIKPLRLAAATGVIISLLAFLYAIYAIYVKIVLGYAVQGWASVMVAVLFIGGIQLMMMGIIGEYLGKLFITQKNRPPYIVHESELSDHV
jgi:dolichol-phosphate mannosyltransferase